MEFILAMLLIFVVTKWVEFSDFIEKWWYSPTDPDDY